jgi:hypothetical protein
MKLRSLFKWTASILLVSGFILCAGIIYLSFKDHSKYFQSRHGSLSEIIDHVDSSHQKHWITLRNSDGFTVECGLLLPRSTGKRYPAIILLGGKATGKYAVDYAMDIDNVIILALDYPYEPRASYNFWTIVQDIPAVRRALFDMVPASMLALDYLCRRSDVDTTKIILLGYSFGAPFVPIISSTDKRIKVAAMVFGGGELHSLIRHNVGRFKGQILSEFVGSLSGLLLQPLEPMRFADKISPIPLVMINGLNDEQIPRYNTELFFNAAKEPKKLIWLESKHVNVNNPELTRRIISTLKEELKRLNIL